MKLTQIILVIATGVLMAFVDIKPYLKSQKSIKKAKDESILK